MPDTSRSGAEEVAEGVLRHGGAHLGAEGVEVAELGEGLGA